MKEAKLHAGDRDDLFIRLDEVKKALADGRNVEAIDILSDVIDIIGILRRGKKWERAVLQ